jgi:hypothetical protein
VPQKKQWSPKSPANFPIPFETQPKDFESSIPKLPNFPFTFLISPGHAILQAKKVTTKIHTPEKTVVPEITRQLSNPF